MNAIAPAPAPTGPDVRPWVDPYELLDATADGVLVLRFGDGPPVVEWASARFLALAGLAATPRGEPPRFLYCHARDRCIADLAADEPLPPQVRLAVRPAVGPASIVDAVCRPLAGGRAVLTCTRVADEQLFESFAESPLPVVVFDRAMRVRWVNGVAERTAGLSRTELAGRDWYEFMPEAAARRTLHEEALASPHSSRTVDGVPMTFPGQATRWFRVHFRPYRDAAGHVAGLVALAEETTERRTIQAALERTQRSLRLAIDGARLAFYEYDIANERFEASDDYYAMRGYPRSVQRGAIEPDWATIHPDDVETVRAEYRRLVADPASDWDVEFRLNTAGGDWLWVLQRGRVVESDAAGRPRRVAGVVIDVDRRKRAERDLARSEEALRRSEERFRLAAEAFDGIIYDADLRTGIVARSRGVREVLGYEPDAMPTTRQGWGELIHPEDAARLTAMDFDDGRRVYELRYRVRHADGRWVEIWDRAFAVRDAAGRAERLVGCAVDVTRERRYQRMLAEAEAVAHVGSWSLDLGTQRLRWSPEAFRILGYGPDAVRPTPELLRARCAPEHRATLDAALDAAAAHGDGWELDVEFDGADGRRRWVRTSGRADREDGRVVRLYGALLDIDALKRAQLLLEEQRERLRASESVLRSVAENSPDFVTIVDHELRIRFVNRALGQIPAAAVVGRPCADFALGDVATMEGNLRRVLSDGGSLHYEVTSERPDGTTRHYEQRLGAIRDGERITGVIVHTTDVTDRRRAERRLRTQARVLATMLEGVVVVDAQATIHLTNPAFDRMFGREPGTLDGTSFAALVDGAVPAGGGPAPFEFVGRRADGTRFDASAVSSALALGTERYVVHVVQDVTERRVLERELLEIANREQRRIGGDLHDGLGQELTGVALMLRGLASRVKRGSPATAAELDELVALVNGAIESTRALARGLSPVELERGGLVYALRALAVRARELYGLDVRFRSRVWPALTLGAAATTHLYRIAQEALTNAARHARAGQVVLALTVRGRSVTLTVTDDGCGLPADPGDGMGLKIMRYRAQMMGGELAIAPVAPGGTRVACRVQQPEPAAGAAP